MSQGEKKKHTNILCAVPTGQNTGDNTNQQSLERVEVMAPPIKAPAAKPEDLCSIRQTSWWKEN